MKVSLGERLSFLRKRENLSQDKLAEEINRKYGAKLNKGMISKWENDKEIPQMTNMKIIANFFGTGADFFFEDEVPGDSLEDWFELAHSEMPEALPSPEISEQSTPEYFAIQRKSKKLNQKDQQRLLKIMEATFDDLDNGDFEEDDDDDL